MTKRRTRRTFTPEFKNKMVQLFQNGKSKSDLTYVRVNNSWRYVCFLVDLFNREIIGHSLGPHKDAALVYKAFAGVKRNLQDIQLFHTDCENEFKNELIDKTLETFNIKRSLSMKGNPYDNAVAKSNV